MIALAVTMFVASCAKSSPQVSPSSSVSPPPSGGIPWAAPSDALGLTRKAGLEPERKETLTFHVHAHLDVFVNGKRVRVPAGIGINITDPGVKHGAGPSYGGISLCDQPCISPLHTHDTTGVLHTEAKNAKPNLLGQFFTEWNVALTKRCVGGYCGSSQIFVNGKRFTGDPGTIPLTDKKEIAIVIGSPPKEIPRSFGP
jgi:hypothetical protein